MFPYMFSVGRLTFFKRKVIGVNSLNTANSWFLAVSIAPLAYMVNILDHDIF